MLLMEIIWIYERRYFKSFKLYFEKKGQSIDFDHIMNFCKIRQEKGEKILRKLCF